MFSFKREVIEKDGKLEKKRNIEINFSLSLFRFLPFCIGAYNFLEKLIVG